VDGEVPFEQVLTILEQHGWHLARISRPYRVFTKTGQLPILIQVHDKMVDTEYVERIKEIIARENAES